MDLAQTIAFSAGLAWASGLRLYLVVFLAGVLAHFGYLQLPSTLAVLQNPVVIGVAGVMAFAELIADNLVVRTDTGGLTIQAGASARLASSTLVTIAMLDTVFEKYLTLLRTRGELDFTQTTPPKSTA